MLAAATAYPSIGYLGEYDASDALTWSRQVGPSTGSSVDTVTLDSDGRILVAGTTNGEFGEMSGGDGFVAKCGPDGQQLWVRSPAPGRGARFADIATDGDGNVFFAGTVDDDLLHVTLAP